MVARESGHGKGAAGGEDPRASAQEGERAERASGPPGCAGSLLTRTH